MKYPQHPKNHATPVRARPILAAPVIRASRVPIPGPLSQFPQRGKIGLRESTCVAWNCFLADAAAML